MTENEFERRWKSGIKAACRATPPQPEGARFGFASRVVAQWQTLPEPSISMLWQQLALRVLGAMALILVVVAAFGALSENGESPLHPPVENAVADSLWLL